VAQWYGAGLLNQETHGFFGESSLDKFKNDKQTTCFRKDSQVRVLARAFYYKRDKMNISVLGSGSSGNCFYIENSKSAVLVDAGLSCKQVVDRLGAIDKSPEKIKAIFVTHEHSDHIRGVDVLARNFNIPVYATSKTIENSTLCSDRNLVQGIASDQTVKVDGMKIETFSKSHAAADPVFYTISQGKKIGIITDAGYACDNINEAIGNCDLLCLESNHDLDMLEHGRYPHFLKNWIKSDTGHLSNLQAGLAVLEYGNDKLKNIILSHLSVNNNTPLLALETFSRLINERVSFKPEVLLSSRACPTRIISL
jgi:phosphoribosyl 1,2-cyclic phosphodiesterase